MIRTTGVAGIFAIVIGAFLLVEGIWGLFSPVVFGVLTTNVLHAVIHIMLGVAGIWTGTKGGAAGFSLFLGVLLLVVGVLRFLPGIDDLIVSLLNVNRMVACLNILIGIVALLIAFSAGRIRTTT